MARPRPELGEQVRQLISLFWRITPYCSGKPLSHNLRTVVAAICWRRRLLPLGIIQRTGIDGIETSVVHKCHDDLFGFDIVTRHSDGQTIWRSLFSLPMMPIFILYSCLRDCGYESPHRLLRLFMRQRQVDR